MPTDHGDCLACPSMESSSMSVAPVCYDKEASLDISPLQHVSKIGSSACRMAASRLAWGKVAKGRKGSGLRVGSNPKSQIWNKAS